MRVSLPMYDVPELLDDHQRLWAGLHALLREEGFVDLPAVLEWPADLDAAWRAPDLLLSQTCGYPLIHTLSGAVQLVGIPHYNAPGCDGANYSSALIVAREARYRSIAELRGGVAGFNERGSQSGYNALRHAVAPHFGGEPFFAEVRETGRHEASIDAVASGAIDIAAVDAVTFALMGRYQPNRTANVRALGFTQPTPGLPLITSRLRSASELARLRAALARLFTISELQPTRERLLLDGISFPPETVYQSIAAQERASAQMGYLALE